MSPYMYMDANIATSCSQEKIFSSVDMCEPQTQCRDCRMKPMLDVIFMSIETTILMGV